MRLRGQVALLDFGEGEQRITLYRGSKDRRSLSFMRFGRTIVLSLRSSETAYLLDVAGRHDDPAAPTLAEVESFRQWRESLDADVPLSVYCQPAETARLYRS